MSNTMIMKCNKCEKNEYQDSKYGINNRVFNKSVKGWRCTICGNIIGTGNETNKKKG